jgi:spore coat polysaccharide biosynthesis protein SpsF
MNIAVIIQARFGSTRLPGKIVKLISGKPLLWHVWNRLTHSKMINDIIIATTTNSEDDQIESFCTENNIHFNRGSVEDVLSRYYETAIIFNVDIIIRITSDCPVIDPVILDDMINFFIVENSKYKLDYLSNTFERTFPRGLDVEIFSFESLQKSFTEAKEMYEREHVTPYIYKHPEIFTIKNFFNEKDYSFHRWTVDTIDDLELIKEIYNSLYDENNIFLTKDILRLFDIRPELIKINQTVKQKNLGE